MENDRTDERDMNRDPLTGEPGSHPIGTGVGAAGGGAAGAAIGAVGGPIGAVVGAAIGAVAGGLAGKGVAEVIDPTAEEAYWRENYSSRSYVEPGSSYEDYQPAYRYGWESRGRYGNSTFDEVETDLERGWEGAKAKTNLTWNRAKHAARDAWDRVERAIPGDADRDGR
jgi:hypothetical protein